MTATTESRPGGEVAVYEASNGEVALNVRLERETVWLTRGQMAAVFASTSENVRQHLRNIFVDGELEESATTKDFLLVRSEGDRRVRRRIRHYDLDAIISVGYRCELEARRPVPPMGPPARCASTWSAATRSTNGGLPSGACGRRARRSTCSLEPCAARRW